MTFTPENIFFSGAVLIFASIVIGKWVYRFGVPTLLLFHLEHPSWWLDAKILLLTFMDIAFGKEF